MKALASNSKWLGLGLGVWAVLACSAEASEPPSTPGGTAGTTAAGGSGAGTAGTSTLPLAGSTSTGTAGSGVGTGGTGSGTAGTTSTAGAGAGTGGTGAGGGGALTTCPSPPAAGAIADLLIDDLEDGDNGVSKVGNRTGYWYTYLDALGSTITPMPDATGAAPLVPGTTNCHGASTKCVIITGMTAAADEVAMKYPYAGVGFDFSNAKKPCVYNASAYTGIKFWARGDVALTIKLNTVQTATSDGGGTCTGAMCNGGFSPAGADVILDTEWTEISIPFATATGPTWALPGPPDKSQLLSLQFQVPPGQASYTVAIDDITFY